MKLVWVLSALVVAVSAKRYCRSDSDCHDLGNLECIYSACPLGICGCRRGKVARFLGSTDNFDCVPLVKIGEKCASAGDKGVCGASNSICRDGRCECINETLYEERWDGEACLPIKNAWASESCSDGIGTNKEGSEGTCKGANWGYDYSGDLLKDLQSHPLDGVANVIACDEGKHISLPNAYDDSDFMGGKAPKCVPIKVGDVCILDDDCKHIKHPDGNTGNWKTGGGECFYDLCKCKDDSNKPDITGIFCGKPLTHGATCATGNKANGSSVCDGTKFLRCGDQCDTATLNKAENQRTWKCVCDPGWGTSATTCTSRKRGDHCYGDYNCKSLGINAICYKGKCDFPEGDNVGGATAISLATATGILALVAHWQL